MARVVAPWPCCLIAIAHKGGFPFISLFRLYFSLHLVTLVLDYVHTAV